jgi:murein DD-endopeptidase MepM/ murein hydrolase activator NlpD
MSGTLAIPAAQEITFSKRARSVVPGELVLVTVRTARPAESVTARAFERDLLPFQTAPLTWDILVGVDLAVQPGAYELSVGIEPARRVAVYEIVVAERRFPTRTLKVDPAFVTPPADAIERIERESRELERIWEASAPERLWKRPFRPPVPHRANSAFGTHSIFNGEPRSQHAGADFRSPAGTPVKAPNAGRIVLASSRYFSGNTVVIDHGLGLFSFFGHLSAIRGKSGDLVRSGQVIGTVGATGRVTGPHLHWSVRANGARVDPLSLLAVLGRS